MTNSSLVVKAPWSHHHLCLAKWHGRFKPSTQTQISLDHISCVPKSAAAPWLDHIEKKTMESLAVLGILATSSNIDVCIDSKHVSWKILAEEILHFGLLSQVYTGLPLPSKKAFGHPCHTCSSSSICIPQPIKLVLGKTHDNTIWVCLKIGYPYTQWLMIIIPTKWL